ncbi:MAG: bifunctional 5,10-methylene-tetrahydrofolate dehydrogenase/5,10-methylene-tetrahydrofolate cyclohydrolase, partial [Candidatus Aureabacteria bacterium]|nr:bifunctional 5,10-methylene-tetrahydrofolate dehydrogenase/5,10-methylene-tetrahydrofolate cyclohydrolase [Candidatus Auribacterota bacterium]
MALILDGKGVAAAIRAEVREGTAQLQRERGIVPGIAFITAGEDPASMAYVTMKERACAEAGIRSWQFSHLGAAREGELLAKINELNADPRVHGVLVQLPLPAGIDTNR